MTEVLVFALCRESKSYEIEMTARRLRNYAIAKYGFSNKKNPL